jgi:hypothetical protein
VAISEGIKEYPFATAESKEELGNAVSGIAIGESLMF